MFLWCTNCWLESWHRWVATNIKDKALKAYKPLKPAKGDYIRLEVDYFLIGHMCTHRKVFSLVILISRITYTYHISPINELSVQMFINRVLIFEHSKSKESR